MRETYQEGKGYEKVYNIRRLRYTNFAGKRLCQSAKPISRFTPDGIACACTGAGARTGTHTSAQTGTRTVAAGRWCGKRTICPAR